MIQMNDLLKDIDNMTQKEYELVVEHSKSMIYRFARKKGYNMGSVDLDMVISHALTDFYKTYKKRNDGYPINLYKIILNRKLLNAYVKSARIYSKETSLLFMNEEHETKNLLDVAYQVHDQLTEMVGHINDLTTVKEEHKECLILFLKGYTYDQIGKIQGISKQRVNNIFKNLSKNKEIKCLLFRDFIEI